MKVDVESRPPVFITGAPRSGTSWLGELLAGCARVRYVYEPFNERWNTRLEGVVRHFEYLRCDASTAPFFIRNADRAISGRQQPLQILRSVYRGYFWQALRPFDRVVVKDPTACLMANWISANYSARVLVIMRHPCAFASSIKNLGWRLDTRRFLEQPHLMADYLSPHEEAIRSAQGDPLARTAAVWCMIHIVLMDQLERNPSWILCKYEDLCMGGEAKLATLLNALGLEPNLSLPSGDKKRTTAKADPGSTQKYSIEMPNIWRQRLTKGEVETVMSVVEEFGLSHLYPESTV